MAKGTAICTCRECGKTFNMEKICRNRREADSWEDYAKENYTLCDECEERHRRQEAEEQRQADEAEGIPAIMCGSEKQRDWATSIRRACIERYKATDWRAELNRILGEKKDNEQALTMLADMYSWLIENKRAASWWIEHRRGFDRATEILDLFQGDAGREYREAAAARSKRAEISAPQADDAKAAVAEAMVKPEQESGKAPVEIIITKTDVKAPYERDDGFIAVMHAIRWEWDREAKCWHKTINETSGSAQDRAAEAGNALLMAGYPVVIWDEEARARAVSGKYEPVTHRWIMGGADDALKVVWERGADDIYNGLRAIQGARYSNGGMLIPLRRWRQLLDLTDTYGFQTTAKAQTMIDRCKAMEEQALVTAPGEPPAVELPKGGLRRILESSAETLPDLMDD